MRPTTITGHLVRFRETWNPVHAFRATRLIVEGGRVPELMYGAWCLALLPPSTVVPRAVEHLVRQVEDNLSEYLRQFLSTAQLAALYGDRYAISDLPSGFEGTRTESVIERDGLLLVGEYGDQQSRIAIVSASDCHIEPHYLTDAGVRHIHAMHAHPDDPQGIIVTTGDRSKRLDHWTLDGHRLCFESRLRKHFAGHTALAALNGQLYGGTDFSSRPNYIERLDGKTFPFPRPAYTKFARSFHTAEGRWLLAISSELDDLGNHNVLSIFDTVNQQFVYCGLLPALKAPPPVHS
ncbi:MAG: hypothetical protein P8R54_21850 [Myxococcota bacterium]|nr:hypothetical protein [Myxococcota bacterium]